MGPVWLVSLPSPQVWGVSPAAAAAASPSRRVNTCGCGCCAASLEAEGLSVTCVVCDIVFLEVHLVRCAWGCACEGHIECHWM